MKKIILSNDLGLGATLSIYSADLGVGMQARLTIDEITLLAKQIKDFFSNLEKEIKL